LKAPPPAASSSAPSFYVGAHLGYGWSKFSAAEDPENNISAGGFLGGFQLGANYQINSIVLGLEGDFSLASVIGRATDPTGAIAGSVRHQWFTTLAGRLGYAYGRTLPYLKGGAAWTRYRWSFDAPGVGNGFGTINRAGWMVGLGVEHAFWDNVSAKIEYNYLDFGKKTETVTGTGGLVADPADIRLYAHLVKLGLNYRFSLTR
jgi:outer membrane immunogenic protein